MPTPQPNCPHCGKSLKRPNAKFCTHCGSPLKATETVHGGSLAKIIVHLPGEETEEIFLSKAVEMIGRRSSNSVQVLSAIVSGEHARLNLTRDGHTITDLNSTNGTYLNGKLLKPNQPHQLANDDVIRLSDGMGNSAKLSYIAPSIFGEISQADMAQSYHLTDPIAFIGRNPNATISLDHLAVSWNHAKLSRQGADSLIIQDLSSHNGTFVNGQQLRRSRPLHRGDAIQIGPFNLVYQGQGKFATFSAERNFRLETVNLKQQFYPTNLFGLADKANPKVVLKNLNLVINPREFVAVVGGSGTGKSTLMRAMSGITPASSGTVLVNGDNLYDNYNLYRTMLGYVPQDDIIHQGLTVRRALYYSARIRLPDATLSEINQRIDEVLEKVGLTTESDTIVRNLSGGQRKRVSIAVELLAEPWIFFLDEPTSGLDPGLEKLMMDTLRQLADEGRTIILVTHATSNILNNCDHVVFLARGAEMTYFGPPKQAMQFFKIDNFPDIYTLLNQSFSYNNDPHVPAEIQAEYQDYLRRYTAKENNIDSNKQTLKGSKTFKVLAGALWADRYRRSAIYNTYITNRQTGEVARPIATPTLLTSAGLLAQIGQFKILSQRYLDLLRHDRVNLGTLLLVMPLIGLFLLLISDRAALIGNSPTEIARILETVGNYNIVTQTETLLFMMALAATMLGVFAASSEIIKERAIYQRERMINLGIIPYLASKFVVLGGFALLQCLALLFVVGLKVSYPTDGAILWTPLEYYLTLVLTALASISLGLFISTISNSRNNTVYLVLVTLFIQILFSGAIFELTPLSEPLSYLTITRWSLEGLAASTDMELLNQLGQVRVEREIEFGRGLQRVVEDVKTSITFYLNYNHTPLSLFIRWIGLLGHTMLWGLLTLVLLKRQDQV
ncbi:FHA domain-containing protein [Anaerolineales bacterium HSG6]|nr:FHA domain-containing protein [Anaerolineales bacterium HSG6]